MAGDSNGQVTISPLAGKPAPKEMLVDVARLEREYFERKPDLNDPTQTGQLRDQRAPRLVAARRPSPRRTSWPLRQAICDYRRSQGIDGPLYMGKDTHALSAPAQRTALEVLAANNVETIIQSRRRRYADAGHFARHSCLQPRPEGAPRGRHRHHAVAQSAGRRRLQVQPDQWRTGRHRHYELGRKSRQRVIASFECRREARVVLSGPQGCHHASGRLRAALCRGFAQRHRHGRHSLRLA